MQDSRTVAEEAQAAPLMQTLVAVVLQVAEAQEGPPVRGYELGAVALRVAVAPVVLRNVRLAPP